jgi:hypothetical protein
LYQEHLMTNTTTFETIQIYQLDDVTGGKFNVGSFAKDTAIGAAGGAATGAAGGAAMGALFAGAGAVPGAIGGGVGGAISGAIAAGLRNVGKQNGAWK